MYDICWYCLDEISIELFKLRYKLLCNILSVPTLNIFIYILQC